MGLITAEIRDHSCGGSSCYNLHGFKAYQITAPDAETAIEKLKQIFEDKYGHPDDYLLCNAKITCSECIQGRHDLQVFLISGDLRTKKE